LGTPTAAKTLQFRDGYGQVYQNDSAPSTRFKAIEVDLIRFDTPAEASKFVRQLSQRSIGAVGSPRITTVAVAGVPGALSIDDTTKQESGSYRHNVLTIKGNVAIVLWSYDLARGPSAFLRTLATQQYALLQEVWGGRRQSLRGTANSGSVLNPRGRRRTTRGYLSPQRAATTTTNRSGAAALAYR
jgi:hypothetical protein